MENNEELKAEVVEETSTEVAQETPAAEETAEVTEAVAEEKPAKSRRGRSKKQNAPPYIR